MSLPAFISRYALTPMDRVSLFVDGPHNGGFAFRPSGDTSPRLGRKSQKPFGHVKTIALQFVAGKFGHMHVREVAQLKGLDVASFTTTVWKLKRERKSA